MSTPGSPRPRSRQYSAWLVVTLVAVLCAALAFAVVVVTLFLPALQSGPSDTAEPEPGGLSRPLSTVAPVEVAPILFDFSGSESNLYIEYILDASGSMMGQLSDGTLKRDVAREVLITRLRSFPPQAHIGLRAYGHNLEWRGQEEESCRDIELIAPVETGQMERMVTWLQDFSALGMTPLVESIRQALGDFETDPARVNTIIMISDGMETCAANACGQVEELKLQGMNFKLHVVGLDVDAETRAQLQCIARAGEGIYRDAGDAQALNGALADMEQQAADDQAEVAAGATPEPTPTLTDTPTPSPEATGTPTPEPVPTHTPTLAPVPTATPPPTPVPTATPPPTPVPTDTPPPTPVPTDTPPAPTLEPTVPPEVELAWEHNGSTVELVVGQGMVITLESNPSTGYQWSVVEGSEHIVPQIGETEYQADRGTPGLVGGGGKEILHFEAIAAGKTPLTLVYSRLWESVKPAQTFRVGVVVR